MNRALVIGGGLAGAAAACRLAQLGHPVELVERSTGPHDKICGEFLSIEAQQDLAGLGVDLTALGAVRVRTLLLVAAGRAASHPLPFTGLSLSRRVLDEALLERARSLGVTVSRGDTVRGIAEAEGRATREGFADEDRPIVLATGKHAVRGAARRVAPSALIGFKMYFAVPGSDTGQDVAIHLFPEGYAGLEPVEGDRLNLTLLVGRHAYARLGGTWPSLLAHLCTRDPALAARLATAIPVWTKPMAIAGVPYGFVHRPRPSDASNLFRVGDQLAVIPSFSGDGMSIALRSGIAAAEAIAGGSDAYGFHRAMAGPLRRQIRLAGMLTATASVAPGRSLLVTAARHMPSLVNRIIHSTRTGFGAEQRQPCAIT